jgi:hypothetical protein
MHGQTAKLKASSATLGKALRMIFRRKTKPENKADILVTGIARGETIKSYRSAISGVAGRKTFILGIARRDVPVLG